MKPVKTEEIADVFIMLQQALMIYNIEQKSVDEIVDKKLNRLQNMIDKEFGGRIDGYRMQRNISQRLAV